MGMDRRGLEPSVLVSLVRRGYAGMTLHGKVMSKSRVLYGRTQQIAMYEIGEEMYTSRSDDKISSKKGGAHNLMPGHLQQLSHPNKA